ncbi:MAG: hypothetical protein ABIO94_09460 [Opitutaceae bacterium]
MRRVAVIFCAHLLLWVLIAQVNHALSGVPIHLFVGGLYITYSALALRFRDGMITAFLAGLLCDASVPIAPAVSSTALGLAHTHTLLFVSAYTFVHHLRDRLSRNETAARVLVALFTNLGIFVVFAFLRVGDSPALGAIWSRIVIDLACSQIFLALVAPWFFALQERSLILAGVEREHLAKSP